MSMDNFFDNLFPKLGNSVNVSNWTSVQKLICGKPACEKRKERTDTRLIRVTELSWVDAMKRNNIKTYIKPDTLHLYLRFFTFCRKL